MPDHVPIPLAPQAVGIDSDEFAVITAWPFADKFVGRLLKDDIPNRVLFGTCQVWTYRDPDGQLVGFGTLEICDDWAEFTAGQAHPYIPLLAVNPAIESKGYGTTILRHLIAEAAVLAERPGLCHSFLYLDVYTTSEKAIKMYTRLGFGAVTAEPVPDPDEGGKPYLVMACRVSVAPESPTPP